MRTILIASIIGLTTVAGGCAVATDQSSVGQYVDDVTITTRVKAKYAEDPKVSAMRIQVETLNGTVQLAGFATSQGEKDKAAELARGIGGVKSVKNDIVVRAPS